MILPISPRARSRADTLFWGQGPESWVCRYLLRSRTILCILSITNSIYSFINNKDLSLDFALYDSYNVDEDHSMIKWLDSHESDLLCFVLGLDLLLFLGQRILILMSSVNKRKTRVRNSEDLNQKLEKCFKHKASVIRKSYTALHLVLEL